MSVLDFIEVFVNSLLILLGIKFQKYDFQGAVKSIVRFCSNTKVFLSTKKLFFLKTMKFLLGKLIIVSCLVIRKFLKNLNYVKTGAFATIGPIYQIKAQNLL